MAPRKDRRQNLINHVVLTDDDFMQFLHHHLMVLLKLFEELVKISFLSQGGFPSFTDQAGRLLNLLFPGSSQCDTNFAFNWQFDFRNLLYQWIDIHRSPTTRQHSQSPLNPASRSDNTSSSVGYCEGCMALSGSGTLSMR